MSAPRRVATGSSGSSVSVSIGADTASADAEVIMLADEALQSSGVTFDLHVGHPHQ